MARSASLFERLLFRAKLADHAFLVAIAAVIGCLGGLGAVGFRKLISLAQRVTWGDWSPSLELIRAHPGWWIVLAPAVGGLIVGPMVYFLAREAKGHGVPEVMEAVALRAGVIRPRLVVIKSLASAVCIGTGGSVGREGPIVQIGSALGSTIGQMLRVSGRRLRTLVGCGAAAGIAATFNAPIAGALFAVEVILADFAVARFSPDRHLVGDRHRRLPPLPRRPPGLRGAGVPAGQRLGAADLPGGRAAGGAGQPGVHLGSVQGWRTCSTPRRVPPWLAAAAGGLIVGVIGLAHPEVLGVGYEAITDMLQGRLAVELLVALLVLKLLATCLTIGSGGSGGILAPSLFLGATTGGVIGIGAHELLPAVTATPGAYALVGMGAVVAGTTHAPLTAILIIFELTSDYNLIVPLMMSCIIATLVTTRLERDSIYTKKLTRHGVELSHGQDVNVLKSAQGGRRDGGTGGGGARGRTAGRAGRRARHQPAAGGLRGRRATGDCAASSPPRTCAPALEHVKGAPFLTRRRPRPRGPAAP